MNNLSNYGEAELLKVLLAIPGVTLTQNINCFVGLFTQTPGEDNTGEEVALTVTTIDGTEPTSYTRQPASFRLFVSTQDENEANASNVGNITFNAATAPWGNIVAVGIYDTVVNGNLLSYFEIDNTIVNTGEIVQFVDRSIILSL